MKIILFLLQFVFCICLTLSLAIPVLIFFKPILEAPSLIIPYAIYPFDICKSAPIGWKYMKYTYCATCFYVCFIVSKAVFVNVFKPKITAREKGSNSCKFKQEKGFNLYLGKTESKLPVYLPEKSLYQNILITDTIRNWKNKF